MIRILDNETELHVAARERIIAEGRDALARRGRFSLVLSGGGTPRRTYELLAEKLAADRDFWAGTHLYWGDERGVPPDDAESNYRTARLVLLDKVAPPAANVHRLAGESNDPERTAAEYAAAFPARADLILLGLGADGHTASLFPGSPLLFEAQSLFAPATAPVAPKKRLTLTPPVLAVARTVLVLVTGTGKAAALRRVFAAEGSVEETPARLVRDAAWLMDRRAAQALADRPENK